MKKLIAFVTAMALLACSAALAEDFSVSCTADDAAMLDGTALNCQVSESRLETMNAIAGGQADMALITQQELIQGLRGYTEGNVKDDLKLVQLIARNDLYVVCSSETAESAGISSLPELAAYLEEEQYGLSILRCFAPSNEDYASTLLFDAILLDSEVTTDDEEKWGFLSEGMYILIADTAKALELAENGCVVLGALTAERTAEFPDLPCAGECDLPVIPGTWYALVTYKDAMLPEPVSADDNWLSAHHLYASTDDFDLKTEIKDLEDYMIAEGLTYY